MSTGAVTVIAVVLLVTVSLGALKPDARDFILDFTKALRGDRKVPWIVIGNFKERKEEKKG
jgi:hypothetical protein